MSPRILSFLTLCAAATLSACAVVPQSISTLATACPSDTAGALKKVDWTKAEHIRIRVRQDEYAPMVQHFVQNRPYVLTLVNDDTHTHYFSAPGFAHAVLTASTANDHAATVTGCTDTVTLGAGKTVTWRFIATHDGRYLYYDTPFALMPAMIPSGTVVIDEPPAYLLEP